MIRSFQFKLTLLATLVSGVALAVFASAFWSFNKARHKERLDRDLGDIVLMWVDSTGLPDVSEGSHVPFWMFYGEEFEETAFAMRAVGSSDLQRTTNWPASIEFADLPDPAPLRWSFSDSDSKQDPVAFNKQTPNDSQSDMNDWWADIQFVSIEADGSTWRVASVRRDDRFCHVAVNLRAFRKQMLAIATELLLAGLLALAACAAGAWFIAAHALRPVRTLTEVAEQITASDLRRRIPTEGADIEFERLTHVLNAMLERLQCSFEQATRFTADASHELKTPLTIMQGEVELALRRAPEGSTTQKLLSSQLDEISHLKALVQKLLLLSQADSGCLPIQADLVDLSDAVESVAEDLQVLAPELKFERSGNLSIHVRGDPSLVAQVLHNLMANAVRHNARDGWVRFDLTRKQRTACFRISNAGPGIPKEDQDKIFERFYRADGARRGAGLGLGLNLAREIARAHGGELKLVSSEPGETVFELTMPCTEPVSFERADG